MVVVLIGIARPLPAQLDYRPEHVGSWTYAFAKSLPEPTLTAAERQTVLSQLRAIGDVVKSTGLIQPPRGVEIRAVERLDKGCDNEQRLCGQKPIPAWTEVSLMGFFSDGGKIVPKREEPPGFEISVNDPITALRDHEYDYNHLVDAQGHEILTGLKAIDRAGGMVVYDNNNVIISKNGRPLTVPVTRGAYLDALLARHASEQIVVDMLRKEAAAIPAGTRGEPAYVGGDMQTLSRLVSKDAPDATPLVMWNPQYFDATLPRTAVQLITLHFAYGNRYLDEKPAPPDYAPDAIRTYELRQAIAYDTMRTLIR